MSLPMKIKTSQLAYQILKTKLINEVEEVWCMALGPQLKLLEVELIFKGTVDKCIVHPRDIFRFACKKNASHLILAHNHPSGHCAPSPEDIEFTKRIVTLGYWIEIPVVDHIIMGGSTFQSLAESHPRLFRASPTLANL